MDNKYLSLQWGNGQSVDHGYVKGIEVTYIYIYIYALIVFTLYYIIFIYNIYKESMTQTTLNKSQPVYFKEID